jgi:hypothetical protein
MNLRMGERTNFQGEVPFCNDNPSCHYTFYGTYSVFKELNPTGFCMVQTRRPRGLSQPIPDYKPFEI